MARAAIPEWSSLPAEPAWLAILSGIIRRMPMGRYRLMNLLYPRRGCFIARTALENGNHRFVCDLHNNICRDVCAQSRYSVPETSLISRVLGQNMCFVDAGANWGYFTLLAAHLVGTAGKVLAFEPDPRIYRLLSMNVGMNSLGQAEALELALADRPGELSLTGYDNESQDWGLSTLLQSNRVGPRFQIRTAALDDVLDERGIARVDLIKMDIEGGEMLALQGMQRGLAAHRYRRFLLELHNQPLREQGRDPQALLSSLLDYGYIGKIFDDSPELARMAAYRDDMEPAVFLRPLGDLKRAVEPWRSHLFLTLDGAEVL